MKTQLFARASILAFALFFVAAPLSFAWGPTGHRVVARIAEKHLTPEAAAAVEQILGKESLVEASTWPDWIRSDPSWDHAGPWHYINMPDGVRYEDSRKNAEGDAYVKLLDFLNTLRDPDTSRDDKAIALRWITHLVGDLHQPLHVGRADDRGGNAIEAEWFGRDTNMHRIWDSQLIDETGYSFSEYAEILDRRAEVAIESGPAPRPLRWVEESQRYRKRAYKAPEPGVAGTYRYIYDNTALVEQRLKQAGLRLALTLNHALGE